jgi:hypothetical protein
MYHQPLCSLFGKTPEELGLANSGPGSEESNQAKVEVEVAPKPSIEELPQLIEPAVEQPPDEVTAFGLSDLTSRLEAIMWA